MSRIDKTKTWIDKTAALIWLFRIKEVSLQPETLLSMYAKYIKQEIPDLNGTGRTQASQAGGAAARNTMY